MSKNPIELCTMIAVSSFIAKLHTIFSNSVCDTPWKESNFHNGYIMPFSLQPPPSSPPTTECPIC